MPSEEEHALLQHKYDRLMRGNQYLHDDRTRLREQQASDRLKIRQLEAELKTYKRQAEDHELGGCAFHQSAVLFEEENNNFRNELIHLRRAFDSLTRSRVVSIHSTDGNPFDDSPVEQSSASDSDDGEPHTTPKAADRVRLLPRSPTQQRNDFHTAQNYTKVFGSGPGSNTGMKPGLMSKASRYFSKATKLPRSRSMNNMSQRNTSVTPPPLPPLLEVPKKSTKTKITSMKDRFGFGRK